MARGTEKDLQRQVNETFEAFRQTLQDLLAAEARQSVDSTIERLGGQAGPFRVEAAQVDIVIRDLKLAASDQSRAEGAGRSSKPSAAAPRRRDAPKKRRAAKPKGRGRTSVRETLLSILVDADGQLDTEQLRDALVRRGVTTSTDNLHQQLRRLVQAGEIAREGRGVYRKQDSPQAA